MSQYKIFAAAILLFSPLFAESSDVAKENPISVKVSKCCAVNEIILEEQIGVRSCVDARKIKSGVADPPTWNHTFFDLTSDDRPKSYELVEGYPTCSVDKKESVFGVYHHQFTNDDFVLLANGSLVHRLVHQADGTQTGLYLYPQPKYCIDAMIIAHNFSGAASDQGDNIVEFAYICVGTEVSLEKLFDAYIYPIGLSVSVMCLIATFLLYSFLPQLRDLTGKFILGICAFFAIAIALAVVKLYGARDPGVDGVTAEFCLHASVVGVWLCLCSMGHHVWQTVKRKSVFTRVTDGTKLCYYSAFVLGTLSVVSSVAITCHYLVSGAVKKFLTWEVLAAFYAPVTLILLVNLFFYWTTQRRMARKMIYNRSMQHFQVNFDLYIKFLIVISFWWFFFMLSFLDFVAALIYIFKVFNMLEGPLIFIVAMCRTRVAFLFKRYFCIGPCCQTGEFIEEEAKELSIIDNLKAKEAKEDDSLPTTSLLKDPYSDNVDGGGDRDMSRSLFCVRESRVSEVPAPPDPDQPLGRVKRLLKSNSLTAIANINWGWRRETSV